MHEVKGVTAVPLCARTVGRCVQHIRQMWMQASAFKHVHVLQPSANPQSGQMAEVNASKQLLLQRISFPVNVAAS